MLEAERGGKPSARAGGGRPGPLRIGIVGAGPAGLMSALSLERYLAPEAASIVLLDRNSDETDYPGVEYGIQKRACLALERIGLLDRAMARANPATELAFYNARLDKRFRSVSLDPEYTFSVNRQEFLADLAHLLTRTEVRRRHNVERVALHPDRSVTVAGKVGDDPFEERFDLMIAADGIRSVARKQVFPDTAEIFDRGFSAIYLLVEARPETAPEGFLELANSGRSELVMGSLATTTLFPLARGRLAMGIGFDHETRDRLWAEQGLKPQQAWADIPAETKKAIAVALVRDLGPHYDMLVRALDLVPDWDSYKIYLWAMHDTDPLAPPWSEQANVVALGDAAHAMMPTIGMGASLAMEDAEDLARRIGALAGRTPDAAAFRAQLADAVFEPFADARVPVWRDLMGRARTAAEGNFIDLEDRKRFSIGPQIPNKLVSTLVTGVEKILDKID